MTLARGYSIVRKLPEMKVIKESSRIERGDRLELTFHSGSALCIVEEKKQAGS